MKKYIIAVSTFCCLTALVAMFSCRQARSQKPENATEITTAGETPGTATNETPRAPEPPKTDQDANVSGSAVPGALQVDMNGTTWPENMPSDVLKPNGELTRVITAENPSIRHWSVQYGSLPFNELDRFEQDFKNKGFATKSTKYDNSGTLSADSERLSVTLTVGPNGGALTVVEKKQ